MTDYNIYTPIDNNKPLAFPIRCLERKIHAAEKEIERVSKEEEQARRTLEALIEEKNQITKSMNDCKTAVQYLKEHPVSSVLLDIAKTCDGTI